MNSQHNGDQQPVGPIAEAPPDVAAILSELRALVRARRLLAAGQADPTRSAIERQLQHCAEQLEITRVVSAHWPLESRSLLERAQNFANKVMRRLLCWYINPIVEQQNAFNDTTARTLRLLIEAYSELLQQEAAIAAPPSQAAPDQAPSAGQAPADVPSDTAALQSLIEQRASTESPAVLPDIALQASPAQLAQHQQINAHLYLGGSTPLQRLIALVKKLIRFSLRWLINPIVEQQNGFNAAVTETATPLIRADAEVRAALAVRRAGRAGEEARGERLNQR